MNCPMDKLFQKKLFDISNHGSLKVTLNLDFSQIAVIPISLLFCCQYALRIKERLFSLMKLWNKIRLSREQTIIFGIFK